MWILWRRATDRVAWGTPKIACHSRLRHAGYAKRYPWTSPSYQLMLVEHEVTASSHHYLELLRNASLFDKSSFKSSRWKSWTAYINSLMGMLLSSKISINVDMVKSVSPFSKRDSWEVDTPAFATSFNRNPFDSLKVLKISPKFPSNTHIWE